MAERPRLRAHNTSRCVVFHQHTVGSLAGCPARPSSTPLSLSTSAALFVLLATTRRTITSPGSRSNNLLLLLAIRNRGYSHNGSSPVPRTAPLLDSTNREDMAQV